MRWGAAERGAQGRSALIANSSRCLAHQWRVPTRAYALMQELRLKLQHTRMATAQLAKLRRVVKKMRAGRSRTALVRSRRVGRFMSG